MERNEGQKSLGRTVVTAEEFETIAQAVDSTARCLFLQAARLYALRTALFMLLALCHDGGAEAGSQVFG